MLNFPSTCTLSYLQQQIPPDPPVMELSLTMTIHIVHISSIRIPPF